MRLNRILAYAYHIISGGGQLGVIIPERASFGRAAGGIVLGVKIHNRLASVADKVLGLNHLAVLVHHFEVGHGVSDFEHSFCVFPKIRIIPESLNKTIGKSKE